MKFSNLDEKYINMTEKCFFFQKMNGCRNSMLYNIASDHHLGTFSKKKKKKASGDISFYCGPSNFNIHPYFG